MDSSVHIVEAIMENLLSIILHLDPEVAKPHLKTVFLPVGHATTKKGGGLPRKPVCILR